MWAGFEGQPGTTRATHRRGRRCRPRQILPIAALLLGACEEIPVSPGEPGTGVMEVSARELETKSTEGGPAPAVSFLVTNAGEARLTYVVQARDRRFTISPPVGTLEPGEHEEIVLGFASRDLPAGTVGPLDVTVTVEGSRRRPARIAWKLIVRPDPAKPAG
jgi:hypothetical protein